MLEKQQQKKTNLSKLKLDKEFRPDWTKHRLGFHWLRVDIVVCNQLINTVNTI